MESDRCKVIVMNELDKLGLIYNTVELGEVNIEGDISSVKLHKFDFALRTAGLELIVDRNNLIIEKIKDAVYKLVYTSDELPKQNFPDFISKELDSDYTHLSNLFSAAEGITIEKYIIVRKIERVKELLVYDKLSLSDIAFKLQYSSVAHLSNQFKKVIGLSPTFFKQLRKSTA
jgi:AraC-like DNA-binding protein